jgi:RNA recognition motif-containing protein
MSVNLYVGNLSYSSTEASVRAQFEQFGEVTSVNLIADRETGRLRGFGFVEMATDEAAKAAIAALDGKDLDGRAIKVNLAKPKTDRPRSGGGGGGGGRRGGGGGGGGRW